MISDLRLTDADLHEAIKRRRITVTITPFGRLSMMIQSTLGELMHGLDEETQEKIVVGLSVGAPRYHLRVADRAGLYYVVHC